METLKSIGALAAFALITWLIVALATLNANDIENPYIRVFFHLLGY